MESEWSIVWTRTLEGDKEDVKTEEVAEKVDESVEIQVVENGSENDTNAEVVSKDSKGSKDSSDKGLQEFQHRHATEAALDVAERLVSSAGGECAALWTRAGRILRLVAPATPEENSPEMKLQAYKQRYFHIP